MAVERKWTWNKHAEYWHRYDREAGYWAVAVYRPRPISVSLDPNPDTWVWQNRTTRASGRVSGLGAAKRAASRSLKGVGGRR